MEMNEIPGGAHAAPVPDRVGHYNRLLQAREVSPLEAAPGGPPDLSNAAINERVVDTGAELHQIVTDELGDRQELHDIVDEIVAGGGEALRVLRDGDEERLQASPALVQNLEVIVRTDGSRPSFLVRDDAVAQTTSPLGSWGPTLDGEAENLRQAIACVGRIDDPSSLVGFWGTGFLVQNDLIITNRHVLQVVATENNGTWTINDGAKIDFGHEHRGRENVRPRALKQILFTGAKPIDPHALDHTKLDLALIELEPADGEETPTPLKVELAEDWANPDLTMFTIGYPAQPALGAEAVSLLEQLFRSTFGFKRLAPGLVMQPDPSLAPWTVEHDATTLGGNSGSVVVVMGREGVAAGLHYGGTRGDPRANWGHIIGKALDTAGAGSDQTLRQIFVDRGVEMIDSLG
jgi:hypothetical protein